MSDKGRLISISTQVDSPAVPGLWLLHPPKPVFEVAVLAGFIAYSVRYEFFVHSSLKSSKDTLLKCEAQGIER
jgi:hypothetical protein